DKPDLRFGCEIQELEGAVAGKTVRAFVIPAKRSKGKDGMVGGVLARIFEPPPEPEPEPPSEDDPDMAAAFEVIPEPELDTPADAGDADPGPPPVEEAELSWARVGGGGASKGSAAAIAKKPALLKALGAKPGDAVVVSVAEDAHSAAIGAGLARTELGTRLGLIDETRTEPVWVHSYPLFFMREGQWEPFVVVFAAFNSDDDFEVMHNQPDKKHLIKTKAFDLVINGLELASAYVGNSSLAMQRIIWETLFGMQKGDLSRMRAPIEAYRFGMPPHGEVNLGFERLLALMLGVDSLDEVIAYPKTQQCRDLMLDAPGPVPPEAIPELLDHEEGEAAGATDDEQEYDPDAEDSAQEAAA
ncbi:MAG: amino acid--tRNA ligase-related protein, partial [Planctomycetota bacterium]